MQYKMIVQTWSLETFHHGASRYILRGTIETDKWTIYLNQPVPIGCLTKNVPLCVSVKVLGFSTKGKRNVGVGEIVS